MPSYYVSETAWSALSYLVGLLNASHYLISIEYKPTLFVVGYSTAFIYLNMSPSGSCMERQCRREKLNIQSWHDIIHFIKNISMYSI